MTSALAPPLKLIATIAGALVASVLVMAGIASYRPLPLNILKTTLERSIGRELSPLQLSAQAYSGQWDPFSTDFALLVERPSLVDSSGRIAAAAPRAELKLQLATLIGGDAAVKDLLIERANLTVRRTGDGAISIDSGLSD